MTYPLRYRGFDEIGESQLRTAFSAWHHGHGQAARVYPLATTFFRYGQSYN